MATVYLAVQESLNRPVALKILSNPNVPEFSERFLREGRTIAALNHAYIATVYDIGIHEEWHYLSMEYVRGGDLKQRISRGLTPREAVAVVAKIGAALKAAHEQGIVHRDVKPANILFRDDATPLLSDFGIAKHSVAAGDLTVTGALMGTPHYLSPEQAQNKALDGRADLYSLGIVLYEMLLGRKPFDGDSDIHVIFQQVYEPMPRLPSDLAPLQPLLDRMVAKEPADRFRDAGEMLAFIERLGGSIPPRLHAVGADTGKASPDPGSAAPIGGTRSEPRHRQRWSPLLVGLIIGLVLVLVYVRPGSEPTARITATPVAPSGGAEARVTPRDMRPNTTERSPKPTLVLVEPMPPQTTGETPAAEIGSATADPVTVERIEPTAAPAKATDLAVQREIDHYNTLGDERLEQNKLTSPAEDNALGYYRHVLRLDPANRHARSGRIRIADRFAALASVQISRGDLDKARPYIDSGLEAYPSHPRLRALDRRVKLQTGSQRVIRSVEHLFNDIKDKIND